MPDIRQISQSVLVPQLILDSVINKGTPELTSRGEPVHYTGGFAVVFPFKIAGQKWAFRCWYVDIDSSIGKRLNTLSSALKNINLPYFCDFTYEPQGIIVDGERYPTTRMRWVDGKNIKEFLCEHKKESAKLKNLSNDFLAMCKDLHKHGVAHGDLQHGNILVDESGKITLIDYDSVFVPELKGEKVFINGLPDYQHPCRAKCSTASEKLDYFSELVIYTSIAAIAKRPEFVDEYELNDSEHLLFSREDFQDFPHSNIYKQLKSLGGIFLKILAIFEKYLACTAIDQLEPFDVILGRMSRNPAITEFSCIDGEPTYKGETIRLKWAAKNFTQLLLDGKDVTQLTSYPFVVDEDCDVTLIASNGFKTVSKSIHIQAFPAPKISLKTSARKLREGKDKNVTISWSVKNGENALLIWDSQNEQVPNQGNKELEITKTTKIQLEVLGADKKKKFKKELTVGVYNECAVNFSADKKFSIPGAGVVLSWDTKNARKVELEGAGVVPECGSRKYEPSEDTTYTLFVTDAFGRHEYKVKVRMLPLPFIKTLSIPTPEFSNTTKITIPKRRITIKSSIPQVEMKGVNIEIPKVPSLKDLGLDVKLIVPSQKISIWKEVKSLFNYYFKQKKHE